ncbi:hypothetical protein AOT11_07200 [Vibrio vulnificus NBRC 15645 = ATCC 27562]|uniref:VCBS domain-containing protein n=1 Tax=Vibrio vulnificus TaxID=672 RepID=UPI000B7BF7D7|nr:VCBS domain-containing protein [Vibrio vulnificus]ASM97785.1 hypothetical protein AOT11_07200 [Vibrio vulnificus NBRC 15645 = ATCC 27562]
MKEGAAVPTRLHNIDLLQLDDGIYRLDPVAGIVLPATPTFTTYSLDIDVALVDTDGSESITGVELSGLIEGTEIYSGNGDLLGTANGNGVIYVQGAWDNGDTYWRQQSRKLHGESVDGTPQVVKVTINGTNDAATIAGDTAVVADETDAALTLSGT